MLYHIEKHFPIFPHIFDENHVNLSLYFQVNHVTVAN